MPRRLQRRVKVDSGVFQPKLRGAPLVCSSFYASPARPWVGCQPSWAAVARRVALSAGHGRATWASDRRQGLATVWRPVYDEELRPTGRRPSPGLVGEQALFPAYFIHRRTPTSRTYASQPVESARAAGEKVSWQTTAFMCSGRKGVIANDRFRVQRAKRCHSKRPLSCAAGEKVS
eukprot:365353-Chlamydomonas_euryale.AAC.10